MDKPVALLRLAAAAVLSLPLLAHAAGLGGMSVQSFLGQPLRAEIEIVAVQPGEEASLEARLASGNAFAQAGIEFNPALSTIQFTIDKRSDGRSVIRVSTRQPVNEPFVDLLVELRWSTGLFVREYTVLLDPPGYEGPKAQPMAAAPVTTPSASPVPSVRGPAETAPKPAAAEPPAMAAVPPAAEPEPAAAPAEETKPPAAPPAPAPAAAPAAAPAMTAESAQTYEVKKGDTLGEIALQYRPQGVTFHQMLIALQRANEDAFINDNINLVREGRILNIPDAEAAAAVDSADATRLVIAQHADFDEYRSRLGMTVAAAPAKPAAAERTAAGPVTAKPAEPKPAAAKDQLTLSRAEPGKPGAPAAKAAGEDDRVAQQRALEEAQSRVKELEKNVADLQKLLEIRNQQLAQLEQQAGTAPAAAPTAPKPTPAEAPKPAAAPAKPAAEAPKPPAEAPKPAAEAPKPAAEAPKPPTPAAKPKPKPRPLTPPPPPPEPSLIDEFLGNPVALGGLGLVVLLLAGYGAWAWQRKKKSVSKFQDSVLSTGAIAAAAGGAEAASAGTPSVSQSSVSQSAVGGMDTEDVDPIAEADVYMAYGRDAQAEEILKEALQKDPNRVAVLSKLLEIYANRRDAQAFEQIAAKLKGVTTGAGPEWDKATALGRSIDPGNGLYGGAPAMAAAAPAAVAATAAPAAPAVDFDIGGGSSGVSAEPSAALDLDLGGASAPSEGDKTDFSPAGTLILDTEESKAATSGLDFDLGGPGEKPAGETGGMNFELPATSAAPEPSPAPAASGGGLDFDLNLGADTKVAEASAPAAPALDLSEISLDLGTPGEASAAAGGATNGDPKWQEVATKLDLAKAYDEMGDKDGARELLNEVMREGDSAQQGQAQQLLAKLG